MLKLTSAGATMGCAFSEVDTKTKSSFMVVFIYEVHLGPRSLRPLTYAVGSCANLSLAQIPRGAQELACSRLLGSSTARLKHSACPVVECVLLDDEE